ncbi:MAG TPA: hypothetical protein VFN97_03610 [Actinospica sp.]|nr:hypothetical protein [Actinospica sp.]
MGILGKLGKGLSNLTGGVDAEVMKNGIPAQAVVLAVVPTGTTIEIGNGLVERVCEFAVQVFPDGAPEYRTTVRQRMPEIMLARIQPGVSRVAAKVHPQDQQRVALDFNAPPPPVRRAASQDPRHSAAHVLAMGEPAYAVVISGEPLNMTNAQGVPMFAFDLTIMPEGRDPFQVRAGMPTPPRALPLIFPGSRVPVRFLPDNPNAVVIDWLSAGVN